MYTRLQYFSELWKEANIIMTPKPEKDIKHPKNHRSISLFNSMVKTFKKLILNRLLTQTFPKI